MAATVFFLLFLIQVFFLVTTTSCKCNDTNLLNFPALLAFGDSTVDTGNNNYINTLTRSNHPPYGRDFPGHHPTGRFSNGRLVPDFIASVLGIKAAVPPFLDPNLPSNELRTGVSFASAGSGYDELTSFTSGSIPVTKQPAYLRSYVDRLKGIVGEAAARNIINGALVIVSAGTNDYVFNFYDIPTRNLHFTIGGYQDFLLNNLHNFVKELYHIGCRKIVVAGVPPVGCLPIQMTVKLGPLRKCLEDQNSDARSHNRKLANLLPRLESSLPGSRIVYADIYTPLSDMMNHPKKYGFTETHKGCCGTGLLETGPLCSPTTPVCSRPSQYMFWDGIHPTESSYRYLSESLLKAILR